MDSGQTTPNMVLFGASGDLAQRKLLPALYRLHRAGRLPDAFHLTGYGRAELNDGTFRTLAADALAKYLPDDASDRTGFIARLSYVQGDYTDEKALARLGAAIPTQSLPIYYLALPPQAAEEVVECFSRGCLPVAGARVLMEKPFGVDWESAKRLNQQLAGCFPESNVHRIDHYLAKDTVRNLLVLRFANTLFEPIWNRHFVDHIQVSATETLGVENRGGYYDGIGVVRDMIQNHVLLMLALAAMEPPLAGDTESIRDRIADLLKSIEPPGADDFIFGQYDGYRTAKGVDPQSVTPTFAAVRLFIRNWRWHDVPVYLMSGKNLSSRVSEVTFVFKRIPVCLLDDDACSRIDPNVLTLRIQPNEGIRLSIGVKAPGYRNDVLPSALDFRYADLLDKTKESEYNLFTGYERVLLEALAGSPGLSWRSDAIEAAWRLVAPILSREEEGEAPMRYPSGASGADLAADLLARDGRRWHCSDF